MRKGSVIEKGGGGELDVWIDRISFLSESMESTAQPFGCGYPDGRLLLCNNALCILLGYSKKELEERVNWSIDMTPREYRGNEASKLEEINRTGKPQRYEKEYIRKDGTRVPVELLVHPAVDSQGNILFYYSFVTDITERKRMEASLRHSRDELEQCVVERTSELRQANDDLTIQIEERKQAEESLRESQSRLQAVLKSMTEGVVISDPDGNLIDFNDAAIKIHKYKDESDWRKHLSEFTKNFNLYSLNGKPLPYKDWPMTRVLNGETFADYELVVHRKDIDLKGVWSFGGTPVMDKDGNIVLAVVTTHDITERKQAEKENIY